MKSMEQKPRDLWEEAEILFRQELGERKRIIFEAQSKGRIVTSKDMIDSFQHTSNQTSKKYGIYKAKVGDKELFEFNIGRIPTRLDMLFQMLDSTRSFAPEMTGVVWTTSRMLCNCCFINKEACDSLSGWIPTKPTRKSPPPGVVRPLKQPRRRPRVKRWGASPPKP